MSACFVDFMDGWDMCVNESVRVCVCVCAFMVVCVSMYVYGSVCWYVCACVNVCGCLGIIYVFICVCVCVCVCVHNLCVLLSLFTQTHSSKPFRA